MRITKRFRIGTIVGLLIAETGLAQQSLSDKVQILLRSPEKSYYIGEGIVLKARVINNTESLVGFAESSQGMFAVQLLDMQDRNTPDILLPFRKRAMEQKRHSQTMVVELEIAPHSSRDFDIHLDTSGVVTHAGSYKVLVGRRDIESGKEIYSNPITVTMTAKQ